MMKTLILFLVFTIGVLVGLLTLPITSPKSPARMDKTHGQNYIYQPDSMLYITVVYYDSTIVFGPIKTLKYVIK